MIKYRQTYTRLASAEKNMIHADDPSHRQRAPKSTGKDVGYWRERGGVKRRQLGNQQRIRQCYWLKLTESRNQ